MERWEDHVAVVTGASSGMGAAIFESLALAGFIVIGLARRVNLIQDIIDKQKPDVASRMHAHYCDVRLPESVDTAFEYINSSFGGIDVLINNAGIIRTGNLIDMNLTDIHDTIQTNLFGYIYWSRKAAASLIERNATGHIIQINSVTGFYVPRNVGFSVNAYPISKFGLTALKDVLAEELNLIGNRNIKVTVSVF
ncbi:DHRS11.2 family protein [Megaselia abdita]